MATVEGRGAYWALQYNTPFCSWGLPGRVESTAAVVQALSTIAPQESRSLVRQGTTFLVKNKDRYGVWYSGQSTILYFWPHAGGSKLTFSFRPRFGMKARTAQSILYDYYNPEAQVVLAPADFAVSDE